VESVREEEERQRRDILTLRQREKTLLSEVGRDRAGVGDRVV
jgi:hypothetical protein